MHTIILRFIFAAREYHRFNVITEQLESSPSIISLAHNLDTNLVVTHQCGEAQRSLRMYDFDDLCAVVGVHR